MNNNVVNFPIIPRATAIAPEEDPATAMLKAIDRCEKRYGEKFTALVIARRYQIADTIANTHDWRSKARKMFTKETV